MNILIVGGNGGIGLAMVKEALVRFPQAQIHATYRRTKSDYEHSALIWHQVDVTDETQVKNLSQAVNSIDWVINCVGMLHTPTKVRRKISEWWSLTFSCKTSPLTPCQACYSLSISRHF